jgi:hypothetical protein
VQYLVVDRVHSCDIEVRSVDAFAIVVDVVEALSDAVHNPPHLLCLHSTTREKSEQKEEEEEKE